MNPQAPHNQSENEPAMASQEASSNQDCAGELEPSVQESSKNGTWRPRGKIARLRKADRDQVNSMLRDGVPYAEIIAKLGDAGQGLLPRNVSSWHTGVGYERWVKDQEWREDMRADQESGLELLPDFDAGKFNEAALQVAVTQLFRAFRHLGSGELKDKLGGDPEGFARLVHALARACRETVNLQKHREASAKVAALELKHLDPARELSDREHEIITDKMDDYFLKPRRRKAGSERSDTPQPPDPANPATTDHP